MASAPTPISTILQSPARAPGGDLEASIERKEAVALTKI